MMLKPFSRNTEETECYYKLVEAVVLQAVDDYRDALKEFRMNSSLENRLALKEIEDFFESEWFTVLSCGLNGKVIIQKLQEEKY